MAPPHTHLAALADNVSLFDHHLDHLDPQKDSAASDRYWLHTQGPLPATQSYSMLPSPGVASPAVRTRPRLVGRFASDHAPRAVNCHDAPFLSAVIAISQARMPQPTLMTPHR